jgi:hypothetical protein
MHAAGIAGGNARLVGAEGALQPKPLRSGHRFGRTFVQRIVARRRAFLVGGEEIGGDQASPQRADILTSVAGFSAYFICSHHLYPRSSTILNATSLPLSVVCSEGRIAVR